VERGVVGVEGGVVGVEGGVVGVEQSTYLLPPDLLKLPRFTVTVNSTIAP